MNTLDSAKGQRSLIEGRHVLDPSRPRHRESIVWVIPRVADGITAFVYTWVNSQGLAGAALSVFGRRVGEQIFEKVDGIPVCDAAGFADYRMGPLKMCISTDGLSSSVRFEGDRVSLTLSYRGSHVPYRYGSHPDGCPAFFADDRLEQSGHAAGALRIDDCTLEFDALCQRDHSWGERDWDAMHHMKWVNAMSETACVHAVELFAFGRRFLRGYILRDGDLAPVEALTLRYDLDDDLLHRRISGAWTDGLGRTTDVEFTDGGPFFAWDVTPNFTLRDSSMRARIDDHPADAYVDMSWDASYLARAQQYRGAVSVIT